ncbi:hypothetical protein R3O67_29455 [Bacillus cereus]|uniref:hypothetical protein n=1 Tax=Bacillus cereus TaxID=1396 RepID=UPI00307A6A44
MNIDGLTIDEMKEKFDKALDEFIPLRNEEEDGEVGLTEEQRERYVYLLTNYLLPLRQKLFELGEEEYLDKLENQFSYIM